jgi:hypothetical protein
MAIPLLPGSNPLWMAAPFQLNYSVRVRVTLRLDVYRQSFRFGEKPLETTSNFLFPTEFLRYSPYVTSSLMKGWVCRLQLLLALASAVSLRSESRGSHCTVSDRRLRGPGPRIYIPQEQGVFDCPTYNPFARTEYKAPFPTIVPCIFVVRWKCLPSRCLETALHATIFTITRCTLPPMMNWGSKHVGLDNWSILILNTLLV